MRVYVFIPLKFDAMGLHGENIYSNYADIRILNTLNANSS